MDRDLTGNNSALALITGGQGDLGQALAEELRLAGMAVSAPGRADLDVGQPASIERFLGELGRPVDLLINNAGLTRDASLFAMSEAEWDAVLGVNLGGAWRMARAVAPGMIAAGGGHVINVASFSGFTGPAGQANYAASKAGLIGLTESLAEEWGPHGIRVNAVLPGFLETRMTAHLPEEIKERQRRAHVLGRFNTPADAARMITFLHLRQPNVSGQVFQLDSRRRRPGW